MSESTRSGGQTDTSASDDQRSGISRRTLIRRAAATGAIAWAAPQILHMSAAGAQTQTCYAFKLQTSSCTCSGDNGGLNPGPPPNDPSCPSGFNTPFAAAISSNNAQLACPPAGTTVSPTSGCADTKTATITLKQGCLFKFVGYKASNDCFNCADPGTGCTGGVNTNAVTINSANNKNISHVDVVVCCGS